MRRRSLFGQPFVLLGLCCLAHAGAMFAVAEPWWAPNLTMVGLVLAVARAPERWLVCSAAAALTTIVWAVRFPAAVAGTYLGAGWLVRWTAAQWDVSDALVQGTLVATLSGAMALSALWMHGLWSLPLVGAADAHVLLTYAAFCAVRWLVPPGQETAP